MSLQNLLSDDALLEEVFAIYLKLPVSLLDRGGLILTTTIQSLALVTALFAYNIA